MFCFFISNNKIYIEMLFQYTTSIFRRKQVFSYIHIHCRTWLFNLKLSFENSSCFSLTFKIMQNCFRKSEFKWRRKHHFTWKCFWSNAKKNKLLYLFYSCCCCCDKKKYCHTSFGMSSWQCRLRAAVAVHLSINEICCQRYSNRIFVF